MSIGYKVPALAHMEIGVQKKMWKNKIYKKKECTIGNNGISLPSQTKSPESCLSIFSRCKQYQDGNDESVKTFRELSTKVSTIVVNETENRLLKSGKDRYELSIKSKIYFIGQRSYLTWS